MRHCALYRLLALFLAVWLSACYSRVTPPPRPDPIRYQRPIAAGVLLKVNDSGVDWGDNRLGAIVQETLLATGCCGHVYFPVEPREPPPLRLVISATGTVRKEGLSDEAKTALGLLFFPSVLVLLVLPIERAYDLDATITLVGNDQELRRFRVTTSTEVSYGLFASPQRCDEAARLAAFKDLGERIASELSGLEPKVIGPSQSGGFTGSISRTSGPILTQASSGRAGRTRAADA